MTSKMKCRLNRVISMIATTAIAITAFPTIPVSAETGATTYTYSGYDVEYTVKSEWESGQAVEVKITNTGEEAILNWAFKYDTAGEIGGIWNAEIYDSSESTYVVKNCSWNYEIQPAQSVVFGYNLTGGELTVPEKFELYSKKCDITDGYDVQLNITGEWDTRIQGEIVLTNTSELPLEAWELSFDSSFTIDNLWNGRITANDNGRYSAASQSWTNPIAAGASVTLGFTGSKTEGTEAVISNYTLRSVVLNELKKEIDWYDTTDTDGDEIPDVYEINILGTDPQNPDTDGDGLTDYQEVYLTSTDPLVYNSVVEALSDADADCDGDGLSNIDEITCGTDPLNADTDGDGLSDYDEVYVYGTDPLKLDTDDDKLNDGDELTLSTDPLNPDTDSDGILDGDEYYTVEVDETRIDSSLLMDNEAVPSLIVTAQGNANSEIEVSEYTGNEQSDELCIGKTIVISGAEIESGVLSFDVTNTAAFEDYEYADGIVADSIVICYNNGSETMPVLTTVNPETKTVSAEISGTGTYFIANLANIIETWGVSAVENVLDATIDFDYELGGQADIVFVIDVTGSMSGTINNVKKYISSFSEQIESSGVHPSYALVQYGDLIYDGINSTKVIKNGSSNWFKDAASLKNGLNSLTMTHGGDTAECAIDGLAAASHLNMRQSAEKCFVLITDANYKTNNQYGYLTAATLFDDLASKGISVSVVTDTRYYSTYESLTTKTGGSIYNIYIDFSDELLKISNFISEKTNSGYWIALNGLLPYVVKLDGDPNAEISNDTDKDGLSDSEELKEKAVFQLDFFVKAVCDSCGIDYKNSDWCYPDVEVYNYTSNPLLVDSDYDGIDDVDDLYAFDNRHSAQLKTTDFDCGVEYTMNFRDFFKSNSEYHKDLSTVSSLMSTVVYDQTSLTPINNSYKNANTEYDTETVAIKKFLKYHGFDDVRFYRLADDQKLKDSDDDPDSGKQHITDIGFGHRYVEYNGESKEIIAVVIRGTNTSTEEWSSNFDIGCDSIFENDTPIKRNSDWVIAENHMGFDITATRVINYLEYYLENDVTLKSNNKTLWITGHSRGAGISNVVGSRKDNEFETFVYTFASPKTTTVSDSSAASHTSIFNVVNGDDIITCLPLSEWGFKRYGTDRIISINDTCKSEWEKLTGVGYRSNVPNMNGLLGEFVELSPTRNACYEYTCSCHGDGTNDDTINKKTSESEELKYAMPYSTVRVGDNNQLFRCETTAFFMQFLARLAASSSEGANAVATVFTNIAEKYNRTRTDFVIYSLPYVGNIQTPHFQISYFLLAKRSKL